MTSRIDFHLHTTRYSPDSVITPEDLIADALDGRPAGPAQGWIIGRHQLLVSTLNESLNTWLQQKSPKVRTLKTKKTS